MSEGKTIIFGGGSESQSIASMLPALLQSKGIDSTALAALMNNNRGGLLGNNGLGDIIALIIVAAIFGNGNGGGLFGGNNNRNAETDMLMQTLNRNGVDISQLAQAVNCSTDQILAGINSVAGSICNLGNQMGQNTNQIITALLQGNNALSTQLAGCCCDLKQLISQSNYLTERGFCETNQVLAKGFSDIGYSFRDQTCNIEKAIAASTAQILEGQRAAEMRDLQNKLDSLREKNSQQAVILNNAQQTAQFASMLAPIQADLAELKCNQVPVKKIACPETYVPVNRAINENYALTPACGFNAFNAFGNWGGWNNCCGGGSLWG